MNTLDTMKLALDAAEDNNVAAVIMTLRYAISEAEENEAPAYIPYTEVERVESVKLLDKAQTLGERFAFIWETIYDHGNGKHLGALSRAQRDVANKYLEELRQQIREAEQAVVKDYLTTQQAEKLSNSDNSVNFDINQEPVAWLGTFKGKPNDLAFETFDLDQDGEFAIEPLYTAPPQREWVSLTDDEIFNCFNGRNGVCVDIARAISAKLKEKNK